MLTRERLTSRFLQGVRTRSFTFGSTWTSTPLHFSDGQAVRRASVPERQDRSTTLHTSERAGTDKRAWLIEGGGSYVWWNIGYGIHATSKGLLVIHTAYRSVNIHAYAVEWLRQQAASDRFELPMLYAAAHCIDACVQCIDVRAPPESAVGGVATAGMAFRPVPSPQSSSPAMSTATMHCVLRRGSPRSG